MDFPFWEWASWLNCNLFYTSDNVAKTAVVSVSVLFCDPQTLFTFNLSVLLLEGGRPINLKWFNPLTAFVLSQLFLKCVPPTKFNKPLWCFSKNEYKGRPERSGAAGGVSSTDVRKGDSLLLPHFALQAPIWASAWRVIIEKCYSNLHKHPMFLKTYSSTERWERAYGGPCSYCIPLEILLWGSICKNAKAEQMIHQKYISCLKLKPVAR